MSKKIQIVISPDGETVTVDKIGFSGTGCTGAANDIIKALGQQVSSVKKDEYYRADEVHVQEFE